MPGRLLDVLNRVVTRSESSSAKQHQQPDDSNDDSNKKKVSFSKKVNFKPFRSRTKKRSGSIKRDGNNVVAYLQSAPSSSCKSDTGSRKNDTGSGHSVNAGGEFWFNVHRRTATSPSSSSGNVATVTEETNKNNSLRHPERRDLNTSRPSISSISDIHSCLAGESPTPNRCQEFLATASLPTAAKRATRFKRAAKMAAAAANAPLVTYAYDVDPSLHDSQKPSQVPRVKRNLVRDIVDKFNEEAKKRGSTENLLSDSRSPLPGIIEATPENAPNNNQPFSYTMIAGVPVPTNNSPLPHQYLRSKSEYDIGRSSVSPTNEIIYAQVQVVNGQSNGHQNGHGSGETKHKTTIHTSVPRHNPPAVSNSHGDSFGFKIKSPFSKSTGSLHNLDDRNDEHVLNYQRKNKTDHSYYKFDQVDDGDYNSSDNIHQQHPKVHQNRTTNGTSNTRNTNVTNNIGNGANGNNTPLKLRGGGRHTDSEGEDRISFSPTPSKHHLIQLHDPNHSQRPPVVGAGGGTSRNVEKWSENEVGPNSKKYTEHEYIHEVSVSNDNDPLPPLHPPIRDPMLTGTTPLLGSRLAGDMSLKEKFNLLLHGDDRPLERGVLTQSTSENKEDRSTKEWSSYNTADGISKTSSRPHRADDRPANENEAPRLQTERHYRKQESNLHSRSKSKDNNEEESLIWPPPRTTNAVRRENVITPTGRFSPDLKPTYYFGEQAAEQSPIRHQERQVFRESEHQHHIRSRKSADKSRSEFRSTGNLGSRLGQRRNSNDSTGSGVGLLSSKLVKKANAEVNGYELRDIDDSFRFRHHSDRHEDDKFHFDSERGHFGSTSRLNSSALMHRRPSSPREDPFRGRSLLQSTSIDGRQDDLNTERKRIYRHEETKRTTRQHTRSSSQPRSENLDTVDHRPRRAVEPNKSPALKQRHESSERSKSRSQEREQKHHQHRSTKNNDAAYWNENTRSFEQSHHEQSQHKKSSKARNVEQRVKSTTQRHRHGRQQRSGELVHDELDDKMETSESEPQLYSGSQDSHMSLGSRISSTEDEQEEVDNRVQQQRQLLANTENIIAAHINTPDSLVKQMNRKQISYENSQHHRHEEERTSTPTGRRLWFERASDEVDDVRRSQTHLDRLDGNRNLHYSSPEQRNDNSRWTGSATMSRLESNKNRRNNAEQTSHLSVNTVDRRDMRRRKGDDVRILLNNRDIATLNSNGHAPNGHNVARSSSFNSRVGSYHSENESQHSAGSTASNKLKRVNFKSSSKSNGGSNGFRYNSAADLSPIHREALLRSASPARAPSTTGSLKSNDSDASHASNKSVILHATAVADIPPARQYRIRSANTSPAPAASTIGSSGGAHESRTVQRSFSLLSPWKPRKYKEKHEKRRDSSESSSMLRQQQHQNGSSSDTYRSTRHHEGQQKQMAKQQQRKYQHESGETVSHNSSSERLDSLGPLQSEAPPPVKVKSKKKSGILRRHSMPKDSRFANFFRRKKEGKNKDN